MLCPSPIDHFLLPGLLEAEEGGVHSPADVHICEILAPVLKRHPAPQNTREVMVCLKTNSDIHTKSQNKPQNLPVI